jgi:ABC-type branched-subunit amino acid transport system ATPase component
MSWFGDSPSYAAWKGPLLVIEDLHVYYGQAHALQGISLSLTQGVLGVVGRNGMGKTTLCNAITGLVPATGSVRLAGEDILGMPPHAITRRGIAYVPQGRRMWPSLTVDETLRLVAPQRRDIDRVYAMFPRLAERRSNGGSQLSGGEQQMLAIGRALLLKPRVLVMDEPTEGLAPVIVEQVEASLRQLAAEDGIAILLIEQNLGVATTAADRIAVMVNGRLQADMPAAELAADKALQERLLGLRASAEVIEATETAFVSDQPAQVIRVQRAYSNEDLPFSQQFAASSYQSKVDESTETPHALVGKIFDFPVATSSNQAVYVAGTFDTKGKELFFMRQCLEKLGLRAITVDLSTSGRPSSASVHPREVARYHPQGEKAVFSGDRGSSVTAMALAFEQFIQHRRDVGGLISAGGSGGTTLATAAMRVLPIGIPKLMVSTMASGDTRSYVGPSDICMMYSVTDVQGINRISEKVLSNAAHAMAGMMTHTHRGAESVKPALGLTMFGVTTPCVQAVTKRLEQRYDCLVFHATGTGGQSMEKLAASHLLDGVIDVSTTEVADEIAGGVLSAGPTRMDVFAQMEMPYVGSCGALDMVNFGPYDSVPDKFKGRILYRHNPNITLMRTTTDECKLIGEFIGHKLNAMQGPVRFLVPDKGFSAIDQPGHPFYDPQADQALITALQATFKPSARHKLIRLPMHVNDEAFAQALVDAWHDIAVHTAVSQSA